MPAHQERCHALRGRRPKISRGGNRGRGKGTGAGSGRVHGAHSANNPGRGEPAVQGWWAVVRAHSTPRLHHSSFAARALATFKIVVKVNRSSGGCADPLLPDRQELALSRLASEYGSRLRRLVPNPRARGWSAACRPPERARYSRLFSFPYGASCPWWGAAGAAC
jgi:hypothetical protein